MRVWLVKYLVSFVDGKEPWIVYHAMAEPNANWLGRTARAQKFSWNPDNSPNFGRPRGFNISLDSPSTGAPTEPPTEPPTDEPNSSSWMSPKPIISVMLLVIAMKLNT